MNPLDDVTLLIKSFLRKDCVNLLIKSIRKFYPKIKIVVVDDSEKNFNFDVDENIKTYYQPFDSGLSKCRNHGVDQITTPYMVLLDDDFVFTEKTNLAKWLEILKNSELDILGGILFTNGIKTDYYGNFSFDETKRILYCKKNFHSVQPEYKTCDIILNFFIAKTDKLKEYRWDDELKVAEHTAFFFEHWNKIKVGYSELISIEHKQIRNNDYKKYRLRGKEFMNKWMIKKNILIQKHLKADYYLPEHLKKEIVLEIPTDIIEKKVVCRKG